MSETLVVLVPIDDFQYYIRRDEQLRMIISMLKDEDIVRSGSLLNILGVEDEESD